MLKPSITLSIVPSKWQAGWYGWLLLVGLGLLGWSLAGPTALLWVGWLGLLLLVALIGDWWPLNLNRHKRQVKTLQIEPSTSALLGRWLQSNGELSHPQPLKCHYLGPFLIGLKVGGEHLWLWPDSAPANAQRELRRYLLLYPL